MPQCDTREWSGLGLPFDSEWSCALDCLPSGIWNFPGNQNSNRCFGPYSRRACTLGRDTLPFCRNFPFKERTKKYVYLLSKIIGQAIVVLFKNVIVKCVCVCVYTHACIQAHMYICQIFFINILCYIAYFLKNVAISMYVQESQL